jgi:PAS domain S-box-containing protein
VTVYVLLKLLTLSASFCMAAAILVRDPGFRMNRLIGAVVACTGWWSLCEILWSFQTDPVVVARLVRMSSLAWLMVGPIFFQIFVQLAGNRHVHLRRMVPVVYGLALAGIVLYAGTPWCLVGVVPTAWGWGFEFGPLFPVPFLIASIPPTLVILGWRSVYPHRGSGGEQSVSKAAVVGVSFAVVVASATDATLPFMGVQVPSLGSTAIALTALIIATRLHRYGYSLLSAGAFAQEILDTMQDGVVLLHADGRVRDCNTAFSELSGIPRDSLRGRAIASILPALESGWAERLQGGDSLLDDASGVECEIHHASGDPMPVFVSRPVLCRFRNRVVGAAIAVRDLREVIDIRQRLLMTARLAAVGDLSVGIADEIMKPTLCVRSELHWLREEWQSLAEEVEKADCVAHERVAETLEEGKELIDECLEGVERISAIAHDVRGFAGSGSLERGPVDLTQLVEDVIRMAAPRTPAGATISRRLAPRLRVHCARHEMEQVLLNLLVNALQAAGIAGEVEVTSEQLGQIVVICVRDDGEGIEPEVLERIFDPFFTTKPVDQGTGLGLAISYHIVRNHGGEIRVATRPGDGTVFTVELPCA